MSNTMTWYQFTDTGMVGLAEDENKESYASSRTSKKPSLPSLRGFAYGDGFFSTLAVYRGCVLWLPYHQQRVDSHCQALFLDFRQTQQAQLWQNIRDIATELQDGIIKIIVTRCTQNLRGYAHSPNLIDNAALVYIGAMTSTPMESQLATFLSFPNENTEDQRINNKDVLLQQPPIVATCLTSHLCCLPDTLAGLKTLNRLDSVLIAGELERIKLNNPSISEGLVKDMAGHWVEGVMSNVFYQLKSDQAVSNLPNSKTVETSSTCKQWYTPPIEHSGVRGVLRQVIIDKLQAANHPVHIRVLEDDDLVHLQSMFFCNAVRGVMPVKELILRENLSIKLQVSSGCVDPLLTNHH